MKKFESIHTFKKFMYNFKLINMTPQMHWRATCHGCGKYPTLQANLTLVVQKLKNRIVTKACYGFFFQPINIPSICYTFKLETCLWPLVFLSDPALFKRKKVWAIPIVLIYLLNDSVQNSCTSVDIYYDNDYQEV